jgi:hypothetical protein
MARFWMLALVASLLLTAACGGNSNTPATSVVAINVSFVGYKVDPPQSVYNVAKGRDVRIKVESSTADELYVHGYEQKAVIPAGSPGIVEFIADKTGRFDVEMRRSHVKLFQIRVS